MTKPTVTQAETISLLYSPKQKGKPMSGIDRIAALEAENERLRDALEEIKALPGELNLSNYNQDDVEALNASHIQAFNIAETALAAKEGRYKIF